MAIEKKEVEYAKEIGDVFVAVESMIADLKAKKPLAEIAAGNLGKLMTAVEGADQMDDEAQANAAAAYGTVGYHTGRLAALFTAPKPEAPAE